MRILYVDAIYQPGHKNFNTKIMSALSELGEVDVLYGDKRIIAENNDIIKNSYPISTKYYYKKKFLYKLMYRFKFICMWKWVTKFINKSAYDFYFISYIEPISFAIGTKRIRKNCAFVDHLFGQTVSSKFKLYFFKRINPSLKAAFMDLYIKDYAVSLGYENSYYFPHPLIDIASGQNMSENGCIVAPGGNNDSEFISQLIAEHQSLDLKLNKKLIIKGNKEFESKRLKIYTENLLRDDYMKLIAGCSACLLIYSKDYNYRTSGVFYEAVALNKKVFLLNNNTLNNINKEYPGLVSEFCNMDELIELINYSDFKVDYTELKNEHSKDNVTRCLQRIIKN